MQQLFFPKSWSKRFRPYRMLMDAQECVVSIRKTLRQEIGSASDRNTSRVRDDAVKTCNLVERLCQRGRHVPAEEVMDYCDLVEANLIHLESQLMRLLASRRKHVKG